MRCADVPEAKVTTRRIQSIIFFVNCVRVAEGWLNCIGSQGSYSLPNHVLTRARLIRFKHNSITFPQYPPRNNSWRKVRKFKKLVRTCQTSHTTYGVQDLYPIAAWHKVTHWMAHIKTQTKLRMCLSLTYRKITAAHEGGYMGGLGATKLRVHASLRLF